MPHKFVLSLNVFSIDLIPANNGNPKYFLLVLVQNSLNNVKLVRQRDEVNNISTLRSDTCVGQIVLCSHLN